ARATCHPTYRARGRPPSHARPVPALRRRTPGPRGRAVRVKEGPRPRPGAGEPPARITVRYGQGVSWPATGELRPRIAVPYAHRVTPAGAGDRRAPRGDRGGPTIRCGHVRSAGGRPERAARRARQVRAARGHARRARREPCRGAAVRRLPADGERLVFSPHGGRPGGRP